MFTEASFFEGEEGEEEAVVVIKEEGEEGYTAAMEEEEETSPTAARSTADELRDGAKVEEEAEVEGEEPSISTLLHS